MPLAQLMWSNTILSLCHAHRRQTRLVKIPDLQKTLESVPHARLKALQKFKGLPCSLKGLVKFIEVVRIFEMEGRESERERGEREGESDPTTLRR